MKLIKLCERCNSLVSYNYYFGAYICDKCKLRDDSYSKIRISKSNYKNIFDSYLENKDQV